MKIYKRKYDNPQFEDGTMKPNELLGNYAIMQVVSEDAYESIRIGMGHDGKMYLITEIECSDCRTSNLSGSVFEVKEISTLYLNYTGYVDDNDEPIFIGDRLKSKYGYEVTVVRDDDTGEYYGRLVCDDNHTCKDIPYSINKGKGHTKIVSDDFAINTNKMTNNMKEVSIDFGKGENVTITRLDEWSVRIKVRALGEFVMPLDRLVEAVNKINNGND